MLDLLWLVPALPLAGFLVNLAFGSRLPKGVVGAIACASVGAAFGIALGSFFELASRPAHEREVVQTLWTWFAAGSIKVEVAILFDQLSALMTLVVTGVGFLIHVYSTGY